MKPQYFPRAVKVNWKDGGPLAVTLADGTTVEGHAPLDIRVEVNDGSNEPLSSKYGPEFVIRARTIGYTMARNPVELHKDWGRELADAVRLALPELWEGENPHLAERIDDALFAFESQFLTRDEQDQARARVWKDHEEKQDVGRTTG